MLHRQGLIEAIGFDADIKAAFHSAMFDEVIDATDKCIIPGKNRYVLKPLIYSVEQSYFVYHRVTW